jgi:hypothetical protein
MKRHLPILCTGLVLVLVSHLSSQPSGWTPGHFLNNYSARLNLTPDQKVKFESIYDRFFKTIFPIQNQLTSKTAELKMLALKRPSNNISILNKQKEILALELKIKEMILDYRIDALGVLSIEQILLLPNECCLGINPERTNRKGFRKNNRIGLKKRNWSRSGYGMGRNKRNSIMGFIDEVNSNTVSD